MMDILFDLLFWALGLITAVAYGCMTATIVPGLQKIGPGNIENDRRELMRILSKGK